MPSQQSAKARKPGIARVGAKTPKNDTKSHARSRLIELGCDAAMLDTLLWFVSLAARGSVPEFAFSPEHVFAPRDDGKSHDRHSLERLDGRIESLADDLSKLFSPFGIEYIRQVKSEWMLDIPLILRRYVSALKATKRGFTMKGSVGQAGARNALINYVYEQTGKWHDTLLAILCGVERRAWAKWRKERFVPSTQNATEEITIEPPPIGN